MEESKIQEYELNQTTLGKFNTMSNARQLRPTRVNELIKDIESGVGLKAALHVNLKNGVGVNVFDYS